MPGITGSGHRRGFITGLVVGVTASAVLAGGVAVAAIPSTSSGKITACRNKTTGALRAIDAQAGKKCKKTEKSLVWNARGVAGPKGAQGDPGPSGPKGSNAGSASVTLVAGDNYIIATPEFTATADATCYVTSSVAISPVSALPAGLTSIFVRNAIRRNGGDGNDGVYGLYLVSNGLTGQQAAASRASVISISAGETVRFGAYLGNVAAGAVGGTGRAQTAYFCS